MSDFDVDRRVPVAVLGATGIVGQRLVSLLGDHPDFVPVVLAASEDKSGRAYGDAVSWAIEGDVPPSCRGLRLGVPDPDAIVAAGARVVFSALPAGAAGAIESALRERGAAVVTNASPHRADPDVPVVVPEVNPDHLALAERQAAVRPGRGFIAAMSNCSTSGLALALAPLRRFGLRSVSVSTYQSISGAGRRGLGAFDIAGNVIPFIRGEEEKIERETRVLLGSLPGAPGGPVVPAPFEVRAHACRVPVREGHLESVTADLGSAPRLAEIESALAEFAGEPQARRLPTSPLYPIVVRREEDRPQPALDLWAGEPARARGMAVAVGRLRLDGRGLRFFLLVHNTVRGAAGGCVSIAELALARGLVRKENVS